ncbi:MAG: hypothetical protein RL077_4444 [Verrucomicrobiota bacterium]|jgi:hypothetical protein
MSSYNFFKVCEDQRRFFGVSGIEQPVSSTTCTARSIAGWASGQPFRLVNEG